MLARRARIAPAEEILDVGCGTGASLIPASSVAGWATGTDVSVEMLEHVPWPVPLVAADAIALPFRPGSYDVVLSGFVLQFVSDPVAACGEFLRVLRPGGRAVVALPEPQMAGVGDVQAEWMKRLGVPPRARPPESFVEDAFREAGFAYVEKGADEHTFTFSSGEEYVRWQWTHGGRALLSQIPEDQRSAFEADVAAAAEGNRDGDVIPMPTTSHFWVGVTATD
ncbi:MAG TPA: methyltransferase domain-containing protein [Acidimicrobiales bacterium]|nr:methyltransferase domain-containing protein [Acidimicrobiales bacterium]